MQIVIDISESAYKEMCENGIDYVDYDIRQMMKNGVPLQEGHGKIIDVADLLDRICLDDTDENREDNVGEIVTLEDIDFIPAIIEADKAESEV